MEGRTPRLAYLDALRGLAVTGMVLSHVVDSWTREADRHDQAFYTVGFLGGVASPLFLFLAGVATVLSASSKARREGGHAIGARMARRRGWEIFVLAFVFRLQSQLLGLGPLDNMLKVDMLNIMGLSMVAAAALWQVSARPAVRVALFAAATVAVAMITPLVRDVAWLAPLPDPIEAYLRPAGIYAAFPLFAWAGFLFAGALMGELIDAARRGARPPATLQTWTALAAGAFVMAGYAASFQPSIYPSSSFWNDSPTFFFIRLGLVLLLLPAMWIAEQLTPARGFAPMVTLGRSSLFVYWIHVEMVYGVIAEPIKRELTLEGALLATLLLTLALFALVVGKNQWMAAHELRGPFRLLTPILR